LDVLDEDYATDVCGATDEMKAIEHETRGGVSVDRDAAISAGAIQRNQTSAELAQSSAVPGQSALLGGLALAVAALVLKAVGSSAVIGMAVVHSFCAEA